VAKPKTPAAFFWQKGSVESTHKVPTSHYHAKHCGAFLLTAKQDTVKTGNRFFWFPSSLKPPGFAYAVDRGRAALPPGPLACLRGGGDYAAEKAYCMAHQRSDI
jgi:hypothetical protein